MSSFKQFINKAQKHIIYNSCEFKSDSEVEFKFDDCEAIRVHYVEFSPKASGTVGIHVSEITEQDLLYAIDKAFNTKFRDIYVHSFF